MGVARRLWDQREQLRGEYEDVHGTDRARWPVQHPGVVLDGEQVQRSRTSDMIFPVPEIIARLSAITPLLPGDVIFTGTPAGVGVGRTPPRFIQPGDEVETSISGIGSIRQRFVEAR